MSVTIDGQTYQTYGDEAGAKVYHAPSVITSSWCQVGAEVQRKALVTATRALRSYIKTCGVEADPADPQPEELQNATYELAFDLATGKTEAVSGSASGASNIERVKAGSAEVEFFRPQDGTRFGPRTQRVLNEYLSSVKVSSSIAGGGLVFANSGEVCDPFEDRKAPNLVEGFF